MDAILQTPYYMHFLEWKCKDFAKDFTFFGICSQGSNYKYISIGSDDGLVLTKLLAILWTNGGWLTVAYMRHSASMG